MNKILYSQDDIEKQAKYIAEQLNTLYSVEDDGNIVFCPLLQGVVPFFADVCKHINFNPYVEYVGVSSYAGKTQKEFTLYRVPDISVLKDREVWLFDDIADSGKTLDYITQLFLSYGAKEVKTCVLLKKQHCTYPINFYGFGIDNRWVWGYGMDGVDGRGRALNDIYYDAPFV